MLAEDLTIGDVFVECEPTEYEKLSSRERKALKPTTVQRYLGRCGGRANASRVHWQTTRGDWCMPAAAPVTVTAHVTTPARGKARAA